MLIVLVFVSYSAVANRLSVTTMPLSLSDHYEINKVFLGKTIGERVSNIGFERGGKVHDLTVNDGQKVSKNDVIAQLDNALLSERRNQLQAQVRGIEVQIKLAKKETKRLSDLRKKNHVSAQEFDRQESTFQRLLTSRDSTAAQLASAQIDIEKSTLRAPYDAIVLQRFVNEGAYVAPGQSVVRLQQLNIDEVHIGIPQRYLRDLEVGKCYPIQVDTKIIDGCIDKFLPMLSDKTQTVRVIFENKKNEPLLSGQIAKFNLSQRIEKKGAWVPTRALAAGVRGTWQLFRLDNTDQPDLKVIRPILVDVIYAKENRSYVTGPLKEGEIIIPEGVKKYAPGMKVEVMKGR